MRSAILKYGWENFKHEVLEESEDISFLKEREVFWIEHFNSIEAGYNQRHPLYFSKESPKRQEIEHLRSALPEIERMYFQERFSIDEIAKNYGVSFWSIREILLSLGNGLLPRGSVGELARQRLERLRPIACPSCRKDFVRKRSNQRFCSKECSALSLRKHPKKEDTRKAPDGLSPRKWGGIVAAHNRHHEGKRHSTDCLVCIME